MSLIAMRPSADGDAPDLRRERAARLRIGIVHERMSGKVFSLQLHVERCAPLRHVDAVAGLVGGGFVGDRKVGREKRAVLVADRSTLESLGLRPGDLRENVTVDGLPDVTNLPPGTRVRVGGITLRVNGACEPCTHIGEMNGVPDPEAFRLSLIGRRGALCTVVAVDGPARVGDAVEVLVPSLP